MIRKMLKHKLKDVLKKKSKQIKVRGEISGTNYGEVSITSLKKDPIHLGIPMKDAKFSFQLLASGAICFSEGNYRLDNHHNSSLHQHFSGTVTTVEKDTLSGALLHVLGSDFKEVID